MFQIMCSTDNVRLTLKSWNTIVTHFIFFFCFPTVIWSFLKYTLVLVATHFDIACVAIKSSWLKGQMMSFGTNAFFKVYSGALMAYDSWQLELRSVTLIGYYASFIIRYKTWWYMRGYYRDAALIIKREHFNFYINIFKDCVFTNIRTWILDT